MSTYTVQDDGAWVSELQDASGRAIFYPLTTNDAGKKRGGMHVCLPNFGPDKVGVFKQHGFGRELVWQHQSDGVFVLDHPQSGGPFAEYSALHAELCYEASEASFKATLAVHSDGKEELPLSPGFHPYFAVGPEDEVRLNGQLLQLEDFATAQLMKDQETMTLQIGERTLTLDGGAMTTWAVWTEGNRFICVEPTLDGGNFDSVNPPHVLAPGDTQSFTFAISW